MFSFIHSYKLKGFITMIFLALAQAYNNKPT